MFNFKHVFWSPSWSNKESYDLRLWFDMNDLALFLHIDVVWWIGVCSFTYKLRPLKEKCKNLKALANKTCDVMQGREISTSRAEHSNHLPKNHHGCNLRCICLCVLLQKHPRVEFFIGLFTSKVLKSYQASHHL